jgi:predicted Zn-dependent peptidase
VLTVSGNVVPAEVMRAVRRYFGAIDKTGAQTPDDVALKPQSSPRTVTLRSAASHRSAVAVGWAVDGPTPKRLASVDVAVEIVAERVRQQLMLTEAKALSVETLATRRFEPSVAGIVLVLPRAHLPSEGSGAIEREARRLASQAPANDELESAKRRCHRRRVAATSTPLAHAQAERILRGVDPNALDSDIDLVQEVSASDVQSAANTLLVASRATTVEAFAAPLPYGSATAEEGGGRVHGNAPSKRPPKRPPKRNAKRPGKRNAKKKSNKNGGARRKRKAAKPKPKAGKKGGRRR